MASRPVFRQQNIGQAVPGGIKQKDNVAEHKSRRALGDIGNMVTVRGIDGKGLPRVNRPVTRSFCAQLLANAQAAAAEKKKSVAVNVDGANAVNVAVVPSKEGAARKPTQKNTSAAAKPKPEDVIEISPDTKEEVKKEVPSKQKKQAEGSLKKKKKNQTFTSVLSARSKAACGLTDKPKEQIIDVDAADVNNELAVVEYIEDIYKFYKEAEHESRVQDYMDSQPELNAKMRAILIDWLVEVHNKFELMPETLYLAINIIDRYLAATFVPRKELQLVGISAMLTASKYEEIWAPEVNDFVCISERAFTHQQVLVMEKRILGELEWNLTIPTPYVFLARFIKASIPDNNLESMAYFLAELGMMNYATIIYCPSMLAASAVYVARSTLNRSPTWTETLKVHTGFLEYQLTECAKLLVTFQSMAAEDRLKAIYKKYSIPEKSSVAFYPPAKSLSSPEH